MNLIFTLLGLIAIAISIAVIFIILAWLRGVSTLAFPGLGIIIATPLLIFLLLICEFVVVLAAVAAARYRTTPTIYSAR